MSAIRELLGAGTLNGVRVFPAEYAANILILPVGGFLTLGCLIALMVDAQGLIEGGNGLFQEHLHQLHQSRDDQDEVVSSP